MEKEEKIQWEPSFEEVLRLYKEVKSENRLSVDPIKTIEIFQTVISKLVDMSKDISQNLSDAEIVQLIKSNEFEDLLNKLIETANYINKYLIAYNIIAINWEVIGDLMYNIIRKELKEE